MHREHRSWYSPALGRPMNLMTYGTSGKAMIVFPTSGGRFYEYEDFGMVEAVAPFIEKGALCLCTVDSLDNETWLARGKGAAEKVSLHERYERYVLDEVLPYVRGVLSNNDRVALTGCSLGAYHAVNFFFRHPDRFDLVVALSGVYDLQFSVGGALDGGSYFHSPVHYMAHLTDPRYLDRIREGRLVLCCGQGAWEDESLRDMRTLEGIASNKGIPAWFDYWGYDVNHDWPWWRRQMPYFLGKLGF